LGSKQKTEPKRTNVLRFVYFYFYFIIIEVMLSSVKKKKKKELKVDGHLLQRVMGMILKLIPVNFLTNQH
jgi:hypothetical protein